MDRYAYMACMFATLFVLCSFSFFSFVVRFVLIKIMLH